ncbi:MAG: GntP family permease [Bacteroidales bacterium]|nr:GntP family permease [Bacteroidales bacterium]MBK7626164.1 GntP family permease [Bacteroidales bacterium]
MSVLVTSILVGISIIAIIYLTSSLKLKAFIALFIVSVFLAFSTLPADRVIATIKEGFGNTMASIGFLIILGAIIGITLDKTGGTLSIARYILSKTGEKRSVQALGLTGFITGLPIFCDSGFIILSGLAKSFSAKSKIALPFMATVLATSLYSVHCLIPPHPGALAAAGLFQVNIGYLIIAGTLFAVPGALASYFWAKWMTKGKDYPPATEPGVDTQMVNDQLPSPFLSFLPIVVPLLLITVKSLLNLIDSGGHSLITKIFFFPGDPIFALSIGVVLSLFLLKKKTIESMNSVFGEAIEKAGPILIVTAAGGMFGMVIKATGTGEAVGKILAGTNIGLVVPFLIAVLMKTAQGSSTVAIITAASFVAPMLSMLGLDSESGRLLAMLSMGAGSMLVSHANDSYFWVISNFSEIDPGTNLKVYSFSTIVMGTVVFLCVWITSLVVL